MSCKEIFLKQLHEAGFRFTPQREKVLDILHDIEGHATVEEIYDRVQAFSSSVDISTVYRTLELLQDFGFVGVIDLGDGQRRYELVGVHTPHHHLLCRCCGELVEIEPKELEPLIEHLRQVYGFAAEPCDLVIHGVCRKCQASPGKSVM